MSGCLAIITWDLSFPEPLPVLESELPLWSPRRSSQVPSEHYAQLRYTPEDTLDNSNLQLSNNLTSFSNLFKRSPRKNSH